MLRRALERSSGGLLHSYLELSTPCALQSCAPEMPAEQNIDSVAGEDICRGTPVPVRPIDEEDKIELGTLRATVAADELNNAPTYVLPHGLTDQTNLLPTRQVIYIFMGLSVAQACSFLDQTMYAAALASCTIETAHRINAASRQHYLLWLPICAQGGQAPGLQRRTCSQGRLLSQELLQQVSNVSLQLVVCSAVWALV